MPAQLKEFKAEAKQILAFVKSIDIDQKRIRFTFTSDKLDRDREKVKTEAIVASIPEFSNNPVCLACHLHRLDSGKSPVIGSWDTNSFKGSNGTCEMDLIFADTELAKEYFSLYRDKHMRAVSIGYMPMEWHEENNEKDGRFYVITKLELYEISCVAVGSNRQALSKVKGFEELAANKDETGILDQVNSLIQELFDTFEQKMLDQFDEIKSIIIPDSGGLAKGFFSPENSGEQSEFAGKNLSGEKIVKALKKAIENSNNKKIEG